MTTDVGAVVGRFQVAHLSEGHMYLIDQALAQHRNVVVLIGSAKSWGTKKNPLNYATRAAMIAEMYPPPQVTCCPLPDFPGNDKRWSHHLDMTVKGLGWDLGDVTLYAGRDSFRPHYVGEFKVIECDGDMNHISGSADRENIGKLIRPSENFRRGVIYAAQNPPKLEAGPVFSARCYEVVVRLATDFAEKFEKQKDFEDQPNHRLAEAVAKELGIDDGTMRFNVGDKPHTVDLLFTMTVPYR